MDGYYQPGGDIDADSIRALKEDLFKGVEGSEARQDFLDTLLTVSGDKHGTVLMFEDMEEEPRMVVGRDAGTDTATVAEAADAITALGARAYHTQSHPPSGFARQAPERSHLYITRDADWDEERFKAFLDEQTHDATAAFHGYPEPEREAFTPDLADEGMVSGWSIHEDYGASEEERARVLSLTSYAVRNTEEAVDALIETANQRYAALEAMEEDYRLPAGYLTDVVFSPDEFRE